MIFLFILFSAPCKKHKFSHQQNVRPQTVLMYDYLIGVIKKSGMQVHARPHSVAESFDSERQSTT